MPRKPIDTPNELRKRIQKCNHTVSKLMQEMTVFHGTDHFIDWSDLIGRVKQYRDELETELNSKNGSRGAAIAAPSTTPAPEPDEYYGSGESDPEDDDEIAY
jgi:hypothetical protein